LSDLRCTLLSDGSSDRALLFVFDWLLQELRPLITVRSQWADLRQLRKPPRELSKRIATAVDLFPCDLLFIHRDAEREPLEDRSQEIQIAVERAFEGAGRRVPTVAVVPVRMQEAWLLSCEGAIRKASGNPRGDHLLDIPDARKWEALADPKQVLSDLLRRASGATGRRLRKLNTPQMIQRVAELTPEFSPLRRLTAFQTFEANLAEALAQIPTNDA